MMWRFVMKVEAVRKRQSYKNWVDMVDHWWIVELVRSKVIFLSAHKTTLNFTFPIYSKACNVKPVKPAITWITMCNAHFINMFLYQFLIKFRTSTQLFQCVYAEMFTTGVQISVP